MEGVLGGLGHALSLAFAMLWEILWALILGFAISGAVQAVVSRKEMSRLLPDDSPRSLATALALGAASSSCSYAAVALARSVFRRGAHHARPAGPALSLAPEPEPARRGPPPGRPGRRRPHGRARRDGHVSDRR